MTHSKSSEKSRGALIFATNTETVNYKKIAERAARFVEKNLGLPVEIVVGNTKLDNKRFSIDSGQFETWRNFGRCTAYQASPWDETILMDSDYIVLDDSLLKVMDTVEDYAMHSQNVYLDDFTREEPMGSHSLKMLWATVVLFKRTKKSELLFTLVERIERNYPYYRMLYNIKGPNFRNDFAFTIADNIINGYDPSDQSCRIPWPLITVSDPIKSMKIKDSQLVVKDKKRGYVLPQSNLHVLSKQYLLSDQFGDLVP